jgi:hypothetical protein
MSGAKEGHIKDGKDRSVIEAATAEKAVGALPVLAPPKRWRLPR